MSDKQPSQQAALDTDHYHYLDSWDNYASDLLKDAYSKIVQFDIDHLKNSFQIKGSWK